MRLNFKGKLTDESEIRAGFIGCGSHALRNLYPVFRFAPVNLVATCDRRIDKAEEVARRYGARNAYPDSRRMNQRISVWPAFVSVFCRCGFMTATTRRWTSPAPVSVATSPTSRSRPSDRGHTGCITATRTLPLPVTI